MIKRKILGCLAPILSSTLWAQAPIAKMNCSELQYQTYKNRAVVFDGSSSVGSSALNHTWSINGAQVSTDETHEWSGPTANGLFQIDHCVDDGNLSNCETCPVSPGTMYAINDCENPTGFSCTEEYRDGNLLKNVFIRHDDKYLYFLLEYCGNGRFESDQILTVDYKNENETGFNPDMKYSIDYLRTSENSLFSMRIISYYYNNFNESWEPINEAYPNGGTPKFDVNNGEGNLGLGDVAEGVQMSPFGDEIENLGMVELRVPYSQNARALPEIQWDYIGYNTNPNGAFVYNINENAYSTIEVDGLTCDWLGQSCEQVAEPVTDWVNPDVVWSAPEGVTVAVDNVDGTGSDGSLSWNAVAGETHLTAELPYGETVKGATAILIDVKLPNLNWWVGSIRMEMIFTSAPWYLDLGLANILNSSLNDEWVTYRFPLASNVLTAAENDQWNPLTDETTYSLRLGVNLNPNGLAGQIKFDNIRFEKGVAQ